MFQKLSESIIWGRDTNSIRAGVLLFQKETHSFSNCLIFISCLTNNEPIIFAPPITNRLSLRLTYETGRQVSMTPKGKQLGMTLKSVSVQRGISKQMSRNRLYYMEPVEFAGFNVFDYYDINLPGKYLMQVEARALKESLSTKTLEPIFLPPVSIELVVSADAIKQRREQEQKSKKQFQK